MPKRLLKTFNFMRICFMWPTNIYYFLHFNYFVYESYFRKCNMTTGFGIGHLFECFCERKNTSHKVNAEMK